MKKALAGPAKHSQKKKPERRGIVAALRRRIRAAPAAAQKRTRAIDLAVNRRLRRAWPKIERRVVPIWARVARRGRVIGTRAMRWARIVYAKASHVARRARSRAKRGGRWAGKRLRPLGVLLFRGLAIAERRLRRAGVRARRAAVRLSVVITPDRAICCVILASAACLVVSQFVDYRAVEVGQPGYAGLPAATPPTVGAKAAGQEHLYLLIPMAMLAAALAVGVMRTGRRQLGRIVALLGTLSLAIILLVDLPAGLDVGSEASRFSGATAVLSDGFYAELAAAIGLILGGVLLVAAPKAAARYHARPCRTRTNLFGRVASALKRRQRRRASSQGKGERSASPHRSGAASAPASQP
jgi:hypothetical protein